MKTNSLILFVALLLGLVLASSAESSTLLVSDATGNPGDTAVLVTLTLKNDKPYAGSEMGLQFDASRLTLRRIDPGTRIADQSGVGYYEFSMGKACLVIFDFAGNNLPIDSGVIFNVFFDVDSSFTHGQTQIVINELTAVADDLSYDTASIRNGLFTSAFLCGDPNADGAVDISDAVYLIAYIFSGGLPPNPQAAGDANCDSAVDISDAVYLIAFIFSGGPEPCAACK